jgi:hypothetical protein
LNKQEFIDLFNLRIQFTFKNCPQTIKNLTKKYFSSKIL